MGPMASEVPPMRYFNDTLVPVSIANAEPRG